MGAWEGERVRLTLVTMLFAQRCGKEKKKTERGESFLYFFTARKNFSGSAWQWGAEHQTARAADQSKQKREEEKKKCRWASRASGAIVGLEAKQRKEGISNEE